MAKITMLKCDKCGSTTEEDEQDDAWLMGVKVESTATGIVEGDFCSPWCLYQRLEKGERAKAQPQEPPARVPLSDDIPL